MSPGDTVTVTDCNPNGFVPFGTLSRKCPTCPMSPSPYKNTYKIHHLLGDENSCLKQKINFRYFPFKKNHNFLFKL